MSAPGDQLDYDPALKPVLVNLFTEIAILEHLIRLRFEPKGMDALKTAQFGVLNHFCRLGKHEERLSSLAWCFQVEVDHMHATVDSLVARALLTWDGAADPCVRPTDAGRAAHADMIEDMAPEVAQIVGEIPVEDLRVTARTLVELRRTMDNLPDR